jgi:archaemetzincin
VLDRVHLWRVGPHAPEVGLLDRLARSLAQSLRASVRVHQEVFDAAFAQDEIRGQTYSTAVLARFAEAPVGEDDVALGVTEADLYVPVLTFVFGEAQMPGRAGLVSTCRLRDEFYGLPPDAAKLDERLLKEALHEIGHTRGLKHCHDWRCVMVSSHRVERLDIKPPQFCARCARVMFDEDRSFGGIL